MKNLQKLALGLIVGAMAIAFSAFTSAEKSVAPTATTTYYTLNQVSEQYERFGTSQPNTADACDSGPSIRCAIAFADDQGATVDPNNLPASTTYQSPTNGWYND